METSARALCLRNLRRLPILGSNTACMLRCVTLSDGGAPFERGECLLLLSFNLLRLTEPLAEW